MNVFNMLLLLLVSAFYGIAAKAELISSTSLSLYSDEKALSPMPLENRGGWVNPEDLDPMPQCIAQQDQSVWLDAMTKCTSSRCTRRFTFICTHTQWLTQLSCLSSAFSPGLVRNYLPQCGRSVLAKIQLNNWISKYTGRTWLVDIGDADNLLPISPEFLKDGLTTVDVLNKAPTCLTSSDSASSMEAFEHIAASCGFTSSTEETGDIFRSWEYDQSLRSMIALEYETAGLYELTGHSVRHGNYLDKKCFCGAYELNPEEEPCSAPENIDLTRGRLWMNATCGPASLPRNWEDTVKTTGWRYIPIEDWGWPNWVADVPQHLIGLTGECLSDACEVDSQGYCDRIIPSFDRACFCHASNYESCGDQCQNFDNRIDYVNWLHDLCGDVQDWHGLPDNWRDLTEPTALELIPWQWTLKPFNNTSLDCTTHGESSEPGATCAATVWKFGSLALVNIATLFIAILTPGTRKSQDGRNHLRRSRPWYCTGIFMAALQISAIGLNALLTRSTPGYEDISAAQLILLWCTMPRLTSLTALIVDFTSRKRLTFSGIAAPLFADTILQALSSYYMFMTFNYGWEHKFYWGFIEKLKYSQSAQLMYAGAYLWHAAILVTVAVLLSLLNRDGNWMRDKKTCPRICEVRILEEAGLMSNQHGIHTSYGTITIDHKGNPVPKTALKELYTISMISMVFLWGFQWLFWIGFIGLALDEYVPLHGSEFEFANRPRFCPPNLLTLTAVWVVFSWVGILVRVA
ncbi:hypothetical protein LTR84_008756 [Exophiala bonariae]|uniref:Extracellular membrane protein CFEM domain-containing protein n=1 Tax=Exophiala bonariae TaxID=1690606 RepID=A0AAV9MW82_9EURO|nr:hypothetical protein LTR84_008756 [Exophiala bonariae]